MLCLTLDRVIEAWRPRVVTAEHHRWLDDQRSRFTDIGRTVSHVIFTPTDLSSDSKPEAWEYGGRIELPVPQHDMFWDVHLQAAMVMCANGRDVRGGRCYPERLGRAVETGDIIIANFTGPEVPTGCWEHDRGYYLDPVDLHPLTRTSAC